MTRVPWTLSLVDCRAEEDSATLLSEAMAIGVDPAVFALAKRLIWREPWEAGRCIVEMVTCVQIGLFFDVLDTEPRSRLVEDTQHDVGQPGWGPKRLHDAEYWQVGPSLVLPLS
mmetsp:Transcript_57423/g.124819  ORF Transcript_57423/g.124819 Transcript_57423/m.124819 type:complete len:114 (-) Transcript_57423:590-931(-)